MAREFRTIGFIGIGTMGAGMVRNLAKNGFSVIAYNRSKEKLAGIAGGSVRAAESLSDVAQADAVFTCVSNDEAVREIYDAMLPHVAKGNVMVDCSTISVGLAQNLSQQCAKAGVDFLDAPITGSKPGADNGTLVFMVGGKRELFDEMLPVLKAMGTTHVYCGPQSYGQRAKLSLNLTQSLLLESTLEGLVFARKNGVPLSAMEEIFANSGAKNGVASAKMPAIKARDFTPKFKLSLMHKDVNLAHDELKRLGLRLPLSDAVLKVFERAAARNDEDFSTIVKDLESEAGVTIQERE